MNPFVLYLVSGEALYSGAALLLALIAVSPFLKNRWLQSVRILFAGGALGLMMMACPPLPYWLDGLFVGAFVLWLVVSIPPRIVATAPKPPAPARRRLRLAATTALTLLTLLLPALELPHRRRPTFSGPQADHLVVIGDSISAGIGRDEPWPHILQSASGIPVKNLSQAGAFAADALAKTAQLTPADTLVLIEIGGNDLLSDTPSATFETNLDKLLSDVAPNRTVIMFELPLLPHRIAFGQIQRRVAAKYHIQLIPKRYFVQALRAGTSDGLHLSPTSAQYMADMVDSLLKPLLSPPPASSTSPPTAPLTPPQTAH
jgi:acyl-CoA thioesterase I